MTKDEALKLALEVIQDYADEYGPHEGDSGAQYVINKIKEALAESEPWEKFCDSNCVWTDHHPDCKLAHPEQDLWAGATIDERWYITRQPEQEQRNVTEQEHYVLMNSIKASSTVVSKGFLAQPEQEPVVFEKTVCPFCTSEWVTAEQHDRNVDRVEQEPVAHWSDCAVHNEPAYPKGECDCGGYSPEKELFDSARSFYNATVADLQVRITSKDQNKRDVASEAANRLRNALLVYKNITPPQRPWVGLTDEEITTLDMETSGTTHDFVDAVEAALRSKNT
jgi:hypothetical protein